MKDFKIDTNTYKDKKSIIDTNKFKRGTIIDFVTKYELYYHISLGNYIFETLLDVEETSQKLQELNLNVSPIKVLLYIFEIIEENLEKKDIENIVEINIRKKASLHALNDFIAKDKELIGKNYYEKQKIEDIENDLFFNEVMKFNFETNYQKTYEHYNLILTDKLLEDVQNKILNH
jgi:GTPase SAR1 family protein